MRKTQFPMRAMIVVLSMILIAGCSQNRSTSLVKPIVIDTIKSGDGISMAIDYLTRNPIGWTQGMFDSIGDKISSLAAAGDLDKNMLEDKSLKERLFDSSAAMMKRYVDSVFRTSIYAGYAKMRSNLKFLQAKNKIYYNSGLTVDQNHQSLKEVEDIFRNYDEVLRLSKSQFRQKVTYFEDYSLNYSSTKNKIEDNKYYATYFCHNAEITSNVKAFPTRLKQARYDYLSQLEDTIEHVAVRDSFDYARLLNDQSRFYNMANGINQSAIDDLQNFVDNYQEPKKEDGE